MNGEGPPELDKATLRVNGLQLELLLPEAMFRAVDGARRTVEAMVQTDPIRTSETAAIGETHVAFLPADGCFTALHAHCLARVEPASSDSLRDAPLLMFAALIDGGGMTLHRNSGSVRDPLGKANGGGKCEKSDAKQRNFHGCISLRGGGLNLLTRSALTSMETHA